jgi:fucose 4-O-acetylase-like acetyltransferase
MKPSVFGLPMISLIFAISLVVVVLKIIVLISKYQLTRRVMTPLGAASLVIMYLSQPINLTLRSWGGPDFLIVLLSVCIPYLIFQFLQLHWIPRLIFLGINRK